MANKRSNLIFDDNLHQSILNTFFFSFHNIFFINILHNMFSSDSSEYIFQCIYFVSKSLKIANCFELSYAFTEQKFIFNEENKWIPITK